MEEQISRSDFAHCKGIWIPAEVFFNRDLTRLERDLLVDVFYLSNGEHGCRKSNKAFSDFHGVGESAVVKALTSLRRQDYIFTASFNGRTRYLKVNRAKFFGCSIGKNSYAEQEKVPTRHRKRFLRGENEKAVQDIDGEQVGSPRKNPKYKDNREAAEGPPPAASATATAADLPSAFGADAPRSGEDSRLESSPALKAERFVKEFKGWAKHAGISTSTTPMDKKAVIEYFQENEEMTVRHLLAIMLGAWQMDPLDAGDEAGRQKYWYSNVKARRIFTLMRHLTEIQDEINWSGTEVQIERVLKAAQNRFCVKGRKLVQ
jgi:hypothetical protein